jgi:lipid II:glycine glycyltransferase (peptidoglycan interpeptide bridge formation enzyme)
MTLLEETKSIRLSKGYEDYPYFHMPYFTEETIRKLVINKIGRIFYVKKEDSLLCVQFTVSYGNRACALAIGKTQEAYKLGVHPFIMFNIMRTLKEEGYSALNLGPVANDSGKDGLISFKMSFGAEKQTCFGGTTSFLQGNFYNLLHQIYHNQLSVDTIKKALNRLSQ